MTVNEMLTEIADLLKKTGKKPHRGRIFAINKEADVGEAREWLQKIYHNEFLEAKKVWLIQSEENWKTFFEWGWFSQTREMKALQQKIKILKKVLYSKNRPDFFKAPKNDQGSDACCVQCCTEQS